MNAALMPAEASGGDLSKTLLKLCVPVVHMPVRVLEAVTRLKLMFVQVNPNYVRGMYRIIVCYHSHYGVEG